MLMDAWSIAPSLISGENWQYWSHSWRSQLRHQAWYDQSLHILVTAESLALANDYVWPTGFARCETMNDGYWNEERLHEWFATLFLRLPNWWDEFLFPPQDQVLLTTVMSCTITWLSSPHGALWAALVFWRSVNGPSRMDGHPCYKSTSTIFCWKLTISQLLCICSLFISRCVLNWARESIEVSSMNAAD